MKSCAYKQNGPSFNFIWAVVLIVCTVASCDTSFKAVNNAARLAEIQAQLDRMESEQ